MLDHDIIFLSYDESNAEENWLALKKRFPRAKRVRGVRGIVEAHREAGRISDTDFFFIVDGDNKIRDNFSFEIENVHLDQYTIYVWRCFNPVNKLVYGYGAVKLYNKNLLNSYIELSDGDLATSIAKSYQVVDVIASETYFFVTPREAWRGAFRECAKLMVQVGQDNKCRDAFERLKAWSVVDEGILNSSWCTLGVSGGISFGESVLRGEMRIDLINDYDWLHNQFIISSESLN